MSGRLTTSALTLALTIAGSAVHACADDAAIAEFVADYTAKAPATALSAGGTMEDALCTQGKLVAALTKHLGPVVGYKAGLTSQVAQELFGATEPVRGVLYRDMLLQDGAEVPVDYGTRPMFEADLVLVVGDAAINDATTVEAAIAHVAEVRPYIELPDMVVGPDEPLDPVTLTAMGVAPRLGVLGAPIPVEDPAAMAEALETMVVTVTDGEGAAIAEAPGAAVLGNPLNSVLWLTGEGVQLAPGDLVSVGSIGPLMPLEKAKGSATVIYRGLPGDPRVSVRFVE